MLVKIWKKYYRIVCDFETLKTMQTHARFDDGRPLQIVYC